jgi:hypothetical protein
MKIEYSVFVETYRKKRRIFDGFVYLERSATPDEINAAIRKDVNDRTSFQIKHDKEANRTYCRNCINWQPLGKGRGKQISALCSKIKKTRTYNSGKNCEYYEEWEEFE